MENTLPYYSVKLMDGLNLQKQTNPQYSLRAYARELNIHPAVLSLAMKGKRMLPDRDMNSALEKLKLGPDEELLFKKSLKRLN